MTKMRRGLETKPNEESLNEQAMFSFKKKRLKGNMIAVFKYLKGHPREARSHGS